MKKCYLPACEGKAIWQFNSRYNGKLLYCCDKCKVDLAGYGLYISSHFHTITKHKESIVKNRKCCGNCESYKKLERIDKSGKCDFGHGNVTTNRVYHTSYCTDHRTKSNRPKRTKVIQADEILNLKISLNLIEDVNEFLLLV